MVTENKYNPQPAPSGTPDIPNASKPHFYGDKSMTSDKGLRKQKMIDLGAELAHWLYKELREGENYRKHNLDYPDMIILMDFCYQEFFQMLYTDKRKARIGTKTS